MKITESDEIRFWKKVDRSGGPDACWPWKGGTTKDGYGVAHFSGKHTTAHRIAYALGNNTIIDSEKVICHTCDNPPCCNQAHLFIGTHLDNARDAQQKGHYKPDYHRPHVAPKRMSKKKMRVGLTTHIMVFSMPEDLALALETISSALGQRKQSAAAQLVVRWFLENAPAAYLSELGIEPPAPGSPETPVATPSL